MKRKIFLSITLTLSFVLISLTTAQAQENCLFRADTGIVATGDGQILGSLLRVTAVYDHSGEYAQKTVVRFAQINYAPESCQNGICEQTIASQTVSAPIALAPREAVSFDIIPSPNSSAVRGFVFCDGSVKVTVTIIDRSTGKAVDSYFAEVVPWIF